MEEALNFLIAGPPAPFLIALSALSTVAVLLHARGFTRASYLVLPVILVTALITTQYGLAKASRYAVLGDMASRVEFGHSTEQAFSPTVLAGLVWAVMYLAFIWVDRGLIERKTAGNGGEAGGGERRSLDCAVGHYGVDRTASRDVDIDVRGDDELNAHGPSGRPGYASEADA